MLRNKTKKKGGRWGEEKKKVERKRQRVVRCPYFLNVSGRSPCKEFNQQELFKLGFENKPCAASNELHIICNSCLLTTFNLLILQLVIGVRYESDNCFLTFQPLLTSF